MAFAGLIFTILLQRRELQLQRIELENSVRALELQASELAKSSQAQAEISRIQADTANLMKQQSELHALLSHQSDIIATESRLGSVSGALRFHGITASDLREAGVTPEEFAYLLSSFTLGGVWQRALSKGNKAPYQKDTYRYVMCKSEHTRKAWPLMKRMLNPGEFVDRIDATIAAIQREEQVQSP